MTEIYKLIEYDLLDVRLTNDCSRLELSIIWSIYEVSRIGLVLDNLVYFHSNRLADEKGKGVEGFPYFMGKLEVMEFATAESLTVVQLHPQVLRPEDEQDKLYYLNLECCKMDIQAVGFSFAIQDFKGSVARGRVRYQYVPEKRYPTRPFF
jgi:hypothetical protein